MIKNYKLFKESLLNKLEGPSKDEVKSNLRELLNDKKISFEKYIKLYEEYKRTHNSINDISIGDWIRTQQEEFEVINKKKII